MPKTLSALVVAVGVLGFAGAAAATGCSYSTTAESTPVVTADAGQQSTPVIKTPTTTKETAKN